MTRKTFRQTFNSLIKTEWYSEGWEILGNAGCGSMKAVRDVEARLKASDWHLDNFRNMAREVTSIAVDSAYALENNEHEKAEAGVFKIVSGILTIAVAYWLMGFMIGVYVGINLAQSKKGKRSNGTVDQNETQSGQERINDRDGTPG